MRAMSASILYQLRLIVKFEEAGEGWWVPSPAVCGAGVAEHMSSGGGSFSTLAARGLNYSAFPLPSPSALPRGTHSYRYARIYPKPRSNYQAPLS